MSTSKINRRQGSFPYPKQPVQQPASSCTPPKDAQNAPPPAIGKAQPLQEQKMPPSQGQKAPTAPPALRPWPSYTELTGKLPPLQIQIGAFRGTYEGPRDNNQPHGKGTATFLFGQGTVVEIEAEFIEGKIDTLKDAKVTNFRNSMKISIFEGEIDKIGTPQLRGHLTIFNHDPSKNMVSIKCQGNKQQYQNPVKIIYQFSIEFEGRLISQYNGYVDKHSLRPLPPPAITEQFEEVKPMFLDIWGGVCNHIALQYFERDDIPLEKYLMMFQFVKDQLKEPHSPEIIEALKKVQNICLWNIFRKDPEHMPISFKNFFRQNAVKLDSIRVPRNEIVNNQEVSQKVEKKVFECNGHRYLMMNYSDPSLPELGYGAFGRVRECFELNGQPDSPSIELTKPLALKKMKLKDWQGFFNALIEYDTTTMLPDHPNILKPIGFILYQAKQSTANSGKHNCGMLMQICSSRVRPLDKLSMTMMLRNIIAGCAAIHTIGIIHNDIKPSNMMFGPDNQYKLADFGISGTPNMLRRYFKSIGGTYYPPECVDFRKPQPIPADYDFTKIDTWAIGVMILGWCGVPPYTLDHELLTSENPVFQWQESTINFLQQFNDPQSPIHSQFPVLSDPTLRDLILGCISPHQSRFTIKNLANHPYFRQFQHPQRV